MTAPGAAPRRRWLRDGATAAARLALGRLNAVMPKRRKVVLSGYPDTEDSILEIARELVRQDDRPVVILADDPAAASRRLPDVTWCRKRSLRGVLHFLTARHVFFTHGLYLSPVPPRSQTCVNVWHGMPIKRVGHLIGRVPPPATHVVATSRMFAGLVALCFGVPESEVLVTGLPRNDVLVRAAARADAVKAALGLGDAGHRPRLVVWLPTFREAVRGIARIDGRRHDSIFGMDDMDPPAFAAFLREHDCVCIIKAHPMAADSTDRIESDRIRVWRDDDLARTGVSLYEMVGAADLLVTDASSVYVDYLILEKPVVIAFPDLEEYRRTRGFALEPVEDHFAGPVVAAFPALEDAIARGLDADDLAPRRARLAALFHDRRDDGATRRLLRAIMPAAAAAALPHDPAQPQSERPT